MSKEWKEVRELPLIYGARKNITGKSLGEEQARPLKRVRRESGVDWSENS